MIAAEQPRGGSVADPKTPAPEEGKPGSPEHLGSDQPYAGNLTVEEEQPPKPKAKAKAKPKG